MIVLAVGARVILTRNGDVLDGLTNGAQGIKKDIKFLSQTSKTTPIVIIVLFDCPTVGKNTWLKSKFDMSLYKSLLCQFVRWKYLSKEVFQVRLCWATSIHKV